jgi:Flp pilus assembly pilin Flp
MRFFGNLFFKRPKKGVMRERRSEVDQSEAEILISTKGSVSTEQVVLVATLAVGFVTAAVPLGKMLLDYHELIEFVLGLPIPWNNNEPKKAKKGVFAMKNAIQKKNGKPFTRDERGLSTVEYIIILVLIAAAAIGLWTTFGKTIQAKLDFANTQVDTLPE